MTEGAAETEAPAEPARVELGTARIVQRRSRWLARLSLWAAGLATLATTFIRHGWPAYKVYFEEPIPGFKRAVYNQVKTIQPNDALLKGLGIATAVLLCLAVVGAIAARKRRSYGGVRIEGEDVVLVYSDSPERRIPIADIVSVSDSAAGTELELENGSRVEIVGGARDVLKAELEKRRSTLDQLPTARSWLERPANGWLVRALPWLGWFALLGGWQGAGEMANHGRYADVVLLSLLTAAWLGVCAWHAAPARLAIGADGVRVFGRGRSRFVPFAQVSAISRGPMTLALSLTNGKAVTVGRNDEQLALRLSAAFERYRATASRGESPDAHAHVLRRGGRSADEWRVQLQKLAHNQDYRADVLSEEELASVVDDVRVDPEQRVAAALALPKTDEARSRIRIAARGSADEDVQRALEAAAENELAEAELVRAMRRRA